MILFYFILYINYKLYLFKQYPIQLPYGHSDRNQVNYASSGLEAQLGGYSDDSMNAKKRVKQ